MMHLRRRVILIGALCGDRVPPEPDELEGLEELGEVMAVALSAVSSEPEHWLTARLRWIWRALCDAWRWVRDWVAGHG